MNVRNYQKELDKLIEKIELDGVRPKLLLHVCCAPCSSYCLSYLAKYFDIIADFYNPNIAPKEEFDKRAAEFERFVRELTCNGTLQQGGQALLGTGTVHKTFTESSQMGTGTKPQIQINIAEYEPEKFYEIAKGLETIPEGGERCFKCYRLRMEHAAKAAKEIGADYFTTTLSISPLKNAAKINEIGEELATIYGVEHLPSDFKKKEGYKRSIELSREYNLYRQNYCGCVYSKRDKEEKNEEFT